MVDFASALDRHEVVHRINDASVWLAGRGRLSIAMVDGGTQAKVVSKMKHPHPLEFRFHRNRLIRREIPEVALACPESGSANGQWIGETTPVSSCLRGLTQTALRRKKRA